MAKPLYLTVSSHPHPVYSLILLHTTNFMIKITPVVFLLSHTGKGRDSSEELLNTVHSTPNILSKHTKT